MGLKDYAADLLERAGSEILIDRHAEEITEKIDEIATDFLDWYIEGDIDPWTEHRSINELYEQFKIEKGL